MSGLKILLINAEKASGPMEMPSNSLPNSVRLMSGSFLSCCNDG